MCYNISWKDFPGGPEAKTSYYQCRVPRFDLVGELDPTCFN